jgi:hypothetical protein
MQRKMDRFSWMKKGQLGRHAMDLKQKPEVLWHLEPKWTTGSGLPPTTVDLRSLLNPHCMFHTTRQVRQVQWSSQVSVCLLYECIQVTSSCKRSKITFRNIPFIPSVTNRSTAAPQHFFGPFRGLPSGDRISLDSSRRFHRLQTARFLLPSYLVKFHPDSPGAFAISHYFESLAHFWKQKSGPVGAGPCGHQKAETLRAAFAKFGHHQKKANP